MTNAAGWRDTPLLSALQVILAMWLFAGVDSLGKLLVHEWPTGIVVCGRYVASVGVLLAVMSLMGARNIVVTIHLQS